MPIHNTINEDEKIIYSVCSGIMTLEDFGDYVRRIWSHKTYYGFNELFDTTRGDWSEFDFNFLFTVAKDAAMVDTIDPDSKLAWVVLEGKQKSLTDFYKTTKSLTPVKSRAMESFYSLDQALSWLKS